MFAFDIYTFQGAAHDTGCQSGGELRHATISRRLCAPNWANGAKQQGCSCVHPNGVVAEIGGVPPLFQSVTVSMVMRCYRSTRGKGSKSWDTTK